MGEELNPERTFLVDQLAIVSEWARERSLYNLRTGLAAMQDQMVPVKIVIEMPNPSQRLVEVSVTQGT